MRCKEVRKMLVAYTDGEVMSSERVSIESHLAFCPRCEDDLAGLRAGRKRVSDSLKSSAAQVDVRPQAFTRLQAALDDRLPTLSHKQGDSGMRMRWKIAFGTLAAVVIATAIIAGVPSTRAAAGNFFATVFHLELKSLELGYLPEGFEAGPVLQTGSVNVDQSGSNGEGQAGPQVGEQREQSLYQDGDLFVLVSTYKGAGESLPEGAPAEVGGLPAVLQTGLSGVVDPSLGPPPAAGASTGGAVASVSASGAVPEGEGPRVESGAAEIEGIVVESGTQSAEAGSGVATLPAGAEPRALPTISYAGANQLTWIVNGIKVEVLSNLPVEELFKIAEGLKLDE